MIFSDENRLKTEIFRFVNKKFDDKTLILKTFDFLEKTYPNLTENEVSAAFDISKIVFSEMNLLDEAFSASMIYVLTKNSKPNLNIISQYTNQNIAKIIDGLQRINNFQVNRYEKNIENYIKLILTVSEDFRTIFIKIAEQLYLFRNLETFDETVKETIATQNQFIYSQLAHRLGLYNIKTEMEEIAMKFFHPEIYKNIAFQLDATKDEREEYIKDFIKPLKILLKKNDLNFDIKGRSKSIASIWNKMKRQGVGFEKVYDTFAIRVIIDCEKHLEKAQCWQAYSLITDKYKPNPSRLRDWISSPKNNGYESLHTTVFGHEGKWVEVQIRTKRMDEIAEKGHAAHWKYKEYKNDTNKDEVYTQIRASLEKPVEKDESNQEKSKLYSEEIFIFSPKGDIYKMRSGDTVLDFAFAIHSSIGTKCVSARVNGRHLSYKEKLNNGDTVEIVTNNTQKPTREWLRIANSTRTKNKISRILKQLEFKWSSIGREKVQQKFKNLEIEFNDENIKKLQKFFDCESSIELFQSFATEKYDIQKIKKILTEEEISKEIPVVEEIIEQHDLSLKSLGDKFLYIDNHIDTIDYSFSKCCNPIPGDDIIAFITIGKGARIHRTKCSNAKNIIEKYPYRVIPAKWRKDAEDTFEKPVTIMITGFNKDGIANSITNVISNELKLKIRSINIKAMKGNSFKGYVIIEIKSKQQLNSLISRLQKIKDILNVGRIK